MDNIRLASKAVVATWRMEKKTYWLVTAKVELFHNRIFTVSQSRRFTDLVQTNYLNPKMAKKISVIEPCSGISAGSAPCQKRFQSGCLWKTWVSGGRARQFKTQEGYTFDMGPKLVLDAWCIWRLFSSCLVRVMQNTMKLWTWILSLKWYFQTEH